MVQTCTGNLTLFSCPKPFVGHDGIIQRNALANWRALGIPGILLGNDSGVAEAAQEYGFLHIPDVSLSSYGTPLLSDIFNLAQSAATTNLVCYINADILLFETVIDVADIAAQQFPDFLIVGQRWNANIKDQFAPSVDWRETLFRILREESTLNTPWGMDYFIFPRGMIEMPPFIIGRPRWDNWMVWDARRKGIPIIDATDFLPIIHQNHGYEHIPGRVTNYWDKSPESIENQQIVDSLCPDIVLALANVHYAPWCFTQNGHIERNMSARKLLWLQSASEELDAKQHM